MMKEYKGNIFKKFNVDAEFIMKINIKGNTLCYSLSDSREISALTLLELFRANLM